VVDFSEEVSKLTAKISHVKAAKILHHYFGGMPQLKIAQKCAVNQATICRCAEKFKKEVAAKGILEAAKGYEIMEEVSALRSLGVELYKSKATVEEARSGLKILNLFNSLGVPPEEYKTLAKTVSKVKDPDFVKGAMNLIKLEVATGKSYADVVSEYQQLGDEIGERQQAILALKEQKEIQDLDTKKAAAGQKFQLFEAFLGLVAVRSGTEIEKFQKFVPTLVDEAKTGKYDSGFLVNVILGELSGGTLDWLVCQYCEAEFVMLKRRQKGIQGVQLPGKVPMRCPDCGELVKVIVKTPLAVTLKKAIVSVTTVLLKKPGETTPEEKSQSDNQAG
jgi:hypothetical protein